MYFEQTHPEEPRSLVYSPSDLVLYSESPFASWMDHYCLLRPGEFVPDEAAPSMLKLQQRGYAHEHAYLEGLRAQGHDVHCIERSRDTSLLAAQTLEAMRRGHAFIYQGYLRKGLIAGSPDFLVRVKGHSRLGNYLYEPWDAKLATRPREYFVYQLMCYAELLEAAQGTFPQRASLVLGNQSVYDYQTERERPRYERLKNDFFSLHQTFDPDQFPLPAKKNGHRRWSGLASQRLEAADDLVLVHRLQRSQSEALKAAGIHTRGALAQARGTSVPGIPEATLERLSVQAWLQIQPGPRPAFHILPLQSGRGLDRLPPPSPLDVFFDLEGYPHEPHKTEYLFGACTRQGKELLYHDWWACDPSEECQTFEAFVDWVEQGLTLDPSAHVYHYSNHEKTMLTRLARKHATREEIVARWLRDGVLVDLYEVLVQGVLVGGEGYSIKAVEKIYRDTPREGEVANGLDSINCFEEWLVSGEPPDPKVSPLLASIRHYNREDCESTADLARWLLGLQAQARFESERQALHGVWPIPMIPPQISEPRETLRVVVSGFGPFEDVGINPAQQLAQELAQQTLEGVHVSARTLEVSHEAVDAWVEELRSDPPAVVLALGYTRNQAQVEHLPANQVGRQFHRAPDAVVVVAPRRQGETHPPGPIDAQLPASLPGTLPVELVETALASVHPRSVATWASLGADYQPDRSGYLCNYLNFRLVQAFLPKPLGLAANSSPQTAQHGMATQDETAPLPSPPVVRGFVHISDATTLDEVTALLRAMVAQAISLMPDRASNMAVLR